MPEHKGLTTEELRLYLDAALRGELDGLPEDLLDRAERDLDAKRELMTLFSAMEAAPQDAFGGLSPEALAEYTDAALAGETAALRPELRAEAENSFAVKLAVSSQTALLQRAPAGGGSTGAETKNSNSDTGSGSNTGVGAASKTGIHWAYSIAAAIAILVVAGSALFFWDVGSDSGDESLASKEAAAAEEVMSGEPASAADEREPSNAQGAAPEPERESEIEGALQEGDEMRNEPIERASSGDDSLFANPANPNVPLRGTKTAAEFPKLRYWEQQLKVLPGNLPGAKLAQVSSAQPRNGARLNDAPQFILEIRCPDERLVTHEIELELFRAPEAAPVMQEAVQITKGAGKFAPEYPLEDGRYYWTLKAKGKLFHVGTFTLMRAG